MPEIRLKRVDLPDPFGPMSPCTSPALTARSTLEIAVMPPKRLLRFLSSSSMRLSVLALGIGRRCGLLLADRQQAAPDQEIVDQAAEATWHKHDRQDDHRAEHRHAILIIVT